MAADQHAYRPTSRKGRRQKLRKIGIVVRLC